MKVLLLALAILAGCRSRDESPPAKSEPPPARPAIELPSPPPATSLAPPDAGPQSAVGPALEPPAVPGARLVARASVRSFSVCRGTVYWCEENILRAAPVSGAGQPRDLGRCMGSADVACNSDGVYDCGDPGLVRFADGKETVLVPSAVCLGPVADASHVYYIVPGFDDVPDPGVYRVATAGGAPEKLYARTPHEQYMLALEEDALWIGHYGAGIIAKLSKSDGKVAVVVKGQKHMVDLAVDTGSLYWLVEDALEVRRRGKSGGAVEVIGRGVAQEPLLVAEGHAYWVEGGEGQAIRLVHLAPGAREPDEVVAGLVTPWLAVDADTIYLSQLGKPGIFAFAR